MSMCCALVGCVLHCVQVIFIAAEHGRVQSRLCIGTVLGCVY